jgi:hypothetical protein
MCFIKLGMMQYVYVHDHPSSILLERENRETWKTGRLIRQFCIWELSRAWALLTSLDVQEEYFLIHRI